MGTTHSEYPMNRSQYIVREGDDISGFETLSRKDLRQSYMNMNEASNERELQVHNSGIFMHRDPY